MRISNRDGDAHSALPDGQPQKVAHRNAPSLDTAVAGIDLRQKNGVKNRSTISSVGSVVKLSTRSDQAQR